MKTLTDLHSDAVLMHALCQGAMILLDAVPQGNATPASNALVGLLEDITNKADALADRLSEINDGERRAAA